MPKSRKPLPPFLQCPSCNGYVPQSAEAVIPRASQCTCCETPTQDLDSEPGCIFDRRESLQ